MTAVNGSVPHHRIAIVGSGFSGLGMAMRLRAEGEDDFVILERAGDVGGTWRDNTYPGCQCDIPSHLYSLSFAPNPGWTRTYPLQPEIQEYLRRCARESGVLPHIRFNREARRARWDSERRRWRLETAVGELTADVLIAAAGPLAEPQVPAIPGLESFAGTLFHSARWDHGHDLRGERVAVIGNGASAIQFVPRIQPQVARLLVFQRTPAWVLPHPDRAITRAERAVYRAVPPAQKLVRGLIYLSREWLVIGMTRHRRLLRVLERVARRHLRRQVADPELRRKLTPSYEVGCKRILLSNDYYPALAQRNVEVVTEPIREIRPRSIVTADGAEREVDTIILGTGFQVLPPPIAAHVRGRDGRTLAEVWGGSMEAYKGTAVAGFPNLFFLIGPNTGLGHNSMVLMIESQIAYIFDCLRLMRDEGIATVEVRPEAQRRFNERIQRRMPETVWASGGCASWYMDSEGRIPTLWPGFTWRFRQITRSFDAESYVLERRGEAALAPGAEPAVPGRAP